MLYKHCKKMQANLYPVVEGVIYEMRYEKLLEKLRNFIFCISNAKQYAAVPKVVRVFSLLYLVCEFVTISAAV